MLTVTFGISHITNIANERNFVKMVKIVLKLCDSDAMFIADELNEFITCASLLNKPLTLSNLNISASIHQSLKACIQKISSDIDLSGTL